MRTGNLDATETEMDLTMDECLSIQRNMEWQANVLTKLFKALKDAKKHPHLMDGISEYDVDFAKNYFQDIAYACVTLATIAENAMGVLKSIEEEKNMTIEELEARLAVRKVRIEKEETKKHAQDEKNRKEQMRRFLSLKESIKTDLEIGRKLVAAGVGFPAGFDDGHIKFVTDSFRHSFGFYIARTGSKDMKDWGFPDQIGWKNGGACGEWDVMYDPGRDENEILLVHREKMKPDRKADWETVKRFCDRYEEFHKKLHEWLETVK